MSAPAAALSSLPGGGPSAAAAAEPQANSVATADEAVADRVQSVTDANKRRTEALDMCPPAVGEETP
eukprot:CAMPEP_0202812716 /NCGR_PEP_ID=MMETSP1389-20130828/4306_1 /ASSEMBLY_ACC=CAM_ASM_000865 /TAXON_ID=302021 /ORGANISM="Rhodomonas sp., Strain CCMP768" /LENGTH=66 /DNA_ID=CAMNT_0049484177 /DNA_START=323 /DNA_END=522 /DNA_ORIENTATION=-